jgi:hypothetical protein
MLELLPLHLGGDGHATPEDNVDLSHLLIIIGIHPTLIDSWGSCGAGAAGGSIFFRSRKVLHSSRSCPTVR